MTTPMSPSVDEVVAQRLRTQRLTAEPLADPLDVVRLLTAVQAQDAPLSRFSIAMRSAGCRDADVRAAIDDGRMVRTHVLRPTWHHVAAEDLRWLLELTGPRIESGNAARYRQLDLDPVTVDDVHGDIAEMLTGRRFLTRRALGTELGERGRSLAGEQIGHLLMLAELRGLVCSGPLDAGRHTYGLLDELVAPAAPVYRPDAVRELVLRFVTGHGPVAVEDVVRWARVTTTEVRAALVELGDRLESATVDGVVLWSDPTADVPGTRETRALLLPVFDEVCLSYSRVPLPRGAGHPKGSEPRSFAETGGGVVVLDGHDVGWWKRTVKGQRVEVRVTVSEALSPADRELIAAEADLLATSIDRWAEVEFADVQEISSR